MNKFFWTIMSFFTLLALSLNSCEQEEETDDTTNTTTSATSSTTSSTSSSSTSATTSSSTTSTTSTTNGSTTASNNLAANTWSVTRGSTVTTYVKGDSSLQKDVDANTRIYTFADSSNYLNSIMIYFPGSQTVPASGTYNLIDWVTVDATPPTGNQAVISSGGFNGYYSAASFSGTITVTNVADVITIVFTDVKVSTFTGGQSTISGNLSY